MNAGAAWFSSSRNDFLLKEAGAVVALLANHATKDGWHIEPEQHEEWTASVALLQEQLARKIHVLQAALSDPQLEEIETIILEYDMRRRGLRIDCVLLAPGLIVVLEFKRGEILKAHVDQIENYCVNLVEFHAETQRLCKEGQVILFPVLAQTQTKAQSSHYRTTSAPEFMPEPWHHVRRPMLVSSRTELPEALRAALLSRRQTTKVDAARWLDSSFSPSSTILDAALSLYGQHDVSAISSHAAPIALIERCAESVITWIRTSQRDGRNRIIFVSGAPGSGKTLLGLKVVFHPEFQTDTVFVTGNAPLVEVLEAALQRSYRRWAGKDGLTGYPKESAHLVIANSTFKIVKAHAFLGERGSATGSRDGRVLVFDEAQRTYEKGRVVLRSKLEDDEAALILRTQEESYERGCVVVALLGHNQFINSGEVGSGAWIQAARQRGWQCVVADETMELLKPADQAALRDTKGLKETLSFGHLPHSLRFYRNLGIEKWAAELLDGSPSSAIARADQLPSDCTIWITRDLDAAKVWTRRQRVGEERSGLIGSGKGARLAAEGLFVGLKPSIADWMLCPDGDVRSSNTLETVQNQFQIQGLELDYTIVCWDLDLRREGDTWSSFSFVGSRWQRRSNDLSIAKNGYRVLLTRARRGMIIFVPRGDCADQTRPPAMYDAIAAYLLACGAREIPAN
jgi:hypothetical protein